MGNSHNRARLEGRVRQASLGRGSCGMCGKHNSRTRKGRAVLAEDRHVKGPAQRSSPEEHFALRVLRVAGWGGRRPHPRLSSCAARSSQPPGWDRRGPAGEVGPSAVSLCSPGGRGPGAEPAGASWREVRSLGWRTVVPGSGAGSRGGARKTNGDRNFLLLERDVPRRLGHKSQGGPAKLWGG